MGKGINNKHGGFKVLIIGGKETILDMMNNINSICSGEIKYDKLDGIKYCWRI